MSTGEFLDLSKFDNNFILNEKGKNFLNELLNESRSTLETGKYVLSFLKSIITEFEWDSPNILYRVIKYWVKKIQNISNPHIYVAEGVSLHIQKICKDEIKTAMGVPQKKEDEALTMRNITHLKRRPRCYTNESIISSADEDDKNFDISKSEFQMCLKEALEEYGNEIDSTLDNICNQALDHIHTNEYILTLGYSNTLKEFFKNAARKRKFNLIIAECSPYNTGHKLAQTLSSCKNIEITIIPDSTIFAVMSRVIIASYAIGVSGNLCAPAGTNALALAAHTHSVPLLVCCGLYKFVPRFSMVSPANGIDCDGQLLQNPNYLFDYSHAGIFSENITFINPTFDDVSGDLVTLFITNIGAQAPNYIYRLMNDMYEESFNLHPKKLV